MWFWNMAPSAKLATRGRSQKTTWAMGRFELSHIAETITLRLSVIPITGMKRMSLSMAFVSYPLPIHIPKQECFAMVKFTSLTQLQLKWWIWWKKIIPRCCAKNRILEPTYFVLIRPESPWMIWKSAARWAWHWIAKRYVRMYFVATILLTDWPHQPKVTNLHTMWNSILQRPKNFSLRLVSLMARDSQD